MQFVNKKKAKMTRLTNVLVAGEDWHKNALLKFFPPEIEKSPGKKAKKTCKKQKLRFEKSRSIKKRGGNRFVFIQTDTWLANFLEQIWNSMAWKSFLGKCNFLVFGYRTNNMSIAIARQFGPFLLLKHLFI